MSDKDIAQTSLRELPIKSGDKFTHYKRAGAYIIVTLAVKEDTLEPLVVYQEEGTENTWVRTYENFIEEIEHGNKIIPRFLRI